MHMPFVLTPMAADYVGLIAAGFAYGYARLGVPELELRHRIWNGYAYFALAIDAPEAEHDAVFARRTEACRAAIAMTDAYWREQAIPELQRALRWVADLPVERRCRVTTWPTPGTRSGAGWPAAGRSISG